MDIYVWLEIEFETTKKIDPLRIKMRLSSDFIEEIPSVIERMGKGNLIDNMRFFMAIKDLTVDWNLEEKGKKIPCNEEKKRKYFSWLFMSPFKSVKIIQHENQEERIKIKDGKIIYDCPQSKYIN